MIKFITCIYEQLLTTLFFKQFLRRYFYSQSYSHYVMLNDTVRVINYRKAIEKYIKPDDVVLDIGCGIGILSLLAAKKGCKKIYAIDNSPIIKKAEKIAKNNGLEQQITFFKKNLFSFRPKIKVDILLHELIGGFVFDENLINIISYAKKIFLKKGGKIYPNKIDILLAPVTYKTKLQKESDFWSKKQYGLDFSNMVNFNALTKNQYFYKPITINLKNKNDFLAQEKIAYSIDLYRCDTIPKSITLSFIITKSDRLTGFCGFFKIFFDKQIYISTEPRVKNTHWMQFFLPIYLEKPLNTGQTITLKLMLNENIHKWRWMIDLEE